MNTNLKDLIKIDILATVDTVDYPYIFDDEGKKKKDNNGNYEQDKTRVQVYSVVKEGDKKINYTFTIQKELTIAQMDEMEGKTFLFSNVSDYQTVEKNAKGYKSLKITYGAKDYKEVSSDKPVFEINRFASLLVDSIYEEEYTDYNTKQKKTNTVFQVIYKVDRRKLIKEIVLENTKSTLYKSMIDKKVDFSYLDVRMVKGNKVFYTKKAPKLSSNTSNPNLIKKEPK